MGEWVLQQFRTAFGGASEDISFLVFSDNPSADGSRWKGAWDLVNTIYDSYIVPVGIGIMVIWFLVAFVQKASSEQMNFDQLFLLFVKLIASFYLMQHGMDLLANIWGIGLSLMKIGPLANASGSDLNLTLTNDVLAEAWSDLTGGCEWGDGTNPELPGFWRSIGASILLVPPVWMSAIIWGCVTFIAYSRTLEMMLRVAAAPIALSDFFSEGLHSNAWRYLKTFLAICLQGFCILLIVVLHKSVSASLISGGGFMNACVQYLVVSFSAVALMFKSLSFCKELVGV